MNNEIDIDRRRPGRPQETLGAFDISQHLAAIRVELPELAEISTQRLCGRMLPYLGGVPNPATFSLVTKGRRRISPRFLNALHNAFLDDDRYDSEPALRQLRPDIWIRPIPGTEQDYELVPLEEFRSILAAARASDAYTYLRPHAEARPWINFGSYLNPQLQGYIGSEDEPEAPRIPTILVGDRMTFRIDMPFAGYLTVLSYDPAPAGRASSQTYCLNSLFGLDGGRIAAVGHEMPRNGRNVKASGEPSKSAMIGLATRTPVELQWVGDRRDPVPIDDLRKFLVEIISQPEDGRSIAIFDFKIEAAPRA